jgi:hypothetical protein
MHTVAVLVLLAIWGAPVAQERTTTSKLPQKGDNVVVKGCLRGSALESTETTIAGAEAESRRDAWVFRLTGDKALLKKMRQEQDGRVVEVSGILKSKLQAGDDLHGATIGNTRVRIGVGGGSGGGAIGSPVHNETNRSIPVLEVKSYEGVPVKCGG